MNPYPPRPPQNLRTPDTLRFGLNLRFRNSRRWPIDWYELYEQNLQMATFAEELGYDGVWVPDHHSNDEGYGTAPLVKLAAIAARTTTIRLGTQVLLLPLRHPVDVAEESCVIDGLAAGRLILTVGAGYLPSDFTAVGMNFHERGSRMDEALEMLHGLLTRKEPFSYQGQYYRCSDIRVTPPSLQEPHLPVYVAVRSVPAARRAARFGLSANMLLRDQEGPEQLYRIYAEELEKNGFGPETREIATLKDGFIGRTREEALKIGGEYLEADRQTYVGLLGQGDRRDRAVITQTGYPSGILLSPDDYLRSIESSIQLCSGGPNLGWVNVGLWLPGLDFQRAKEAVAFFAQTVIARFR